MSDAIMLPTRWFMRIMSKDFKYNYWRVVFQHSHFRYIIFLYVSFFTLRITYGVRLRMLFLKKMCLYIKRFSATEQLQAVLRCFRWLLLLPLCVCVFFNHWANKFYQNNSYAFSNKGRGSGTPGRGINLNKSIIDIKFCEISKRVIIR